MSEVVKLGPEEPAMGEVEDTLRSTEWKYGDQDPEALAELKSRIEAAGRSGATITYSKLADGVAFRLAEMNNGRPYYLDVQEWHGIDRRIISSFLGRMAVDSYLEAGFFASALVVRRGTGLPTDSFFKWMKELELIPDREADTERNFWLGQRRRAHQYYSDNR